MSERDATERPRMSGAPIVFATLAVLSFLHSWGAPRGDLSNLWLTAPAFAVPLIALIIWNATHSEPVTWIVSGLLFAIFVVGFRLLGFAALHFS
jgi:hypothetical protein